MNLAILYSCLIVVSLYIFISVSGYLTVVGQPTEDQLRSTFNILDVDYQGNIWFLISIGSLIVSVFCCAPVGFICQKDIFESLYYKRRMTNSENIKVTLITLIGCYLLAIVVPLISDIITVIGTTTNPLVGFVFPSLFYIKLNPELKAWKKILAISVMIVASVASLTGFVIWVYDKTQ